MREVNASASDLARQLLEQKVRFRLRNHFKTPLAACGVAGNIATPQAARGVLKKGFPNSAGIQQTNDTCMKVHVEPLIHSQQVKTRLVFASGEDNFFLSSLIISCEDYFDAAPTKPSRFRFPS